MQSAKLNITCSAMFCCSFPFNLLKLGYLFVTLGQSSLCSYIGFNQSKPICLPSNTATTTHKKNCSMSSISINSLLWKLSKNSLNTSQAGSPVFGDFPNLWYNNARKRSSVFCMLASVDNSNNKLSCFNGSRHTSNSW